MKYHVRIRSLSNRHACSTQGISTQGGGLFSRTSQSSERKRKFTSASRELYAIFPSLFVDDKDNQETGKRKERVENQM